MEIESRIENPVKLKTVRTASAAELDVEVSKWLAENNVSVIEIRITNSSKYHFCYIFYKELLGGLENKRI